MRALHRPDVGGTQRWLIVTLEYPAIFIIVNASAPILSNASDTREGKNS